MTLTDNEIAVLSSKQARGAFAHAWSAQGKRMKNTLFPSYCMPMYAFQLCNKYTQTYTKRLRVAYNNAYRICITYPEM